MFLSKIINFPCTTVIFIIHCIIVIHTVCPRSLDLFYEVTYNVNGSKLLGHLVVEHLAQSPSSYQAKHICFYCKFAFLRHLM